MPAVIVNFDDVLFHDSGASPRPDAIRLLKDVEAAGWQIAITSELPQVEVRQRLDPFLPDIAENVMVISSEIFTSSEEGSNTVTEALTRLRTVPEETLVLERGVPGFHRAQAADLACVVVMDSLPTTADLTGARLVIDGFGISDDDQSITVLADPLGINPTPLVTVQHLESCLREFQKEMNEYGTLRSGQRSD